ncbi:MAG: 50S ribosomal protein L4 [Candidatus Uhrbacteria bacterium GW2011_GWA2_53_10]|uniref:Large ribosomal subunit protein uL4 n=1 Tax=Candidatus Uhrbacteria bacterium GW2011_GWA2_53_10 TaxID=1618980 RepID=A0A0G1XQ15_9BACT|nr:MAG: 50S ribosomal protein L4 [Candidatus Uhrbacteria bacterium GW2011_GWA2_53_10]
MATVKLYNQEGTSVGELTLEPRLFDVKTSPSVVHAAVVAQEANTRQVLAHTKGRGEVAGTGKKPWKQKGTGRARHGSRRSPIWVGGGITFGPTKERNFSLKLNRKTRQKALAMVLSDKVANSRFVAVETLKLSEPKTKVVAALLKKLPVTGKKTLVVLEPSNAIFSRAVRNLPRVSTLPANSLNVVDLLSHDTVLASKEAIEVITKTYSRS